MDRFKSDNICPRCGSPKMRSWDALDEEQKLLASKLPLSAEYSRDRRTQHRFCTKCWFEETDRSERFA